MQQTLKKTKQETKVIKHNSNKCNRQKEKLKKVFYLFLKGPRRRKESRKRRYRFPTVVKETGVGNNNT